MKISNKPLFISTIIAIALTPATAVYAAGFQLNGQSATGLGRAFAGDAVIADNASVLSRNPAAMILLDQPQLSFGLVVIDTDVTVKNVTTSSFPNIDTPDTSPPRGDSIGSTSYAPNFYYVHPVNDRITLGTGIFSNFGTKTEFSDEFEAPLFGGLTDLKTVNFALSGAYRLNQQFTLGAGVDVITGTGKLRRDVSPNMNALNIDASGVGFGWNIGTVYEYNNANRFGLSYRHSPNIKADGTLFYLPQPINGDLILKLPDIAEFSGYHQITSPLAIHYSVQWIGWSDFDTLSTTDGVEIKRYDWKNGMHYSIGATYVLDPTWTFRTGFMYDTTAQDDLTTLAVPDSNRKWLSGGLSYNVNQNMTVDFGLTYLIGEDTYVNESVSIDPLPLTLTTQGTTRANALLYGAQFSYRF